MFWVSDRAADCYFDSFVGSILGFGQYVVCDGGPDTEQQRGEAPDRDRRSGR